MRKFWIIFILIFYILSNTISFSEEADLRIHFIDVGEGDSILIQTPKDNAVLIDTGNLITGFKVVKYLEKKGVKNLEYLIITHLHPDHFGGVFFVLQMTHVKKIFDNGESLTNISNSSDLYRWYEELVRRDNRYDILESGDEFSIDGVKFKGIWPYQSFMNADFNSNSLVIVIEYKTFRCLLTGDLIIAAEREILKRSNDLKAKADVLKVGHHGSEDSSSKEFLDEVSPKISIISVNKNNIRNYPSEKVLQRLKTLRSAIYSTDKNGSIIIKTNGIGEIGVLTEK